MRPTRHIPLALATRAFLVAAGGAALLAGGCASRHADSRGYDRWHDSHWHHDHWFGSRWYEPAPVYTERHVIVHRHRHAAPAPRREVVESAPPPPPAWAPGRWSDPPRGRPPDRPGR